MRYPLTAAETSVDVVFNSYACRFCLQRAHWQAHDGAVTSVDIIPARPISGYSHAGAITSVAYDPDNPTMVPPLIVSGSRDSNVAAWTLDGGLVGVLGEHSWDLEDKSTWQDPTGHNKRPPKPRGEGMYVNVSNRFAVELVTQQCLPCAGSLSCRPSHLHALKLAFPYLLGF